MSHSNQKYHHSFADSLSIYEGDSDASPMQPKYCGSWSPSNHISSTNALFLHFETDGHASINDPINIGFEIEYHVYGKWDLYTFKLF